MMMCFNVVQTISEITRNSINNNVGFLSPTIILTGKRRACFVQGVVNLVKLSATGKNG